MSHYFTNDANLKDKPYRFDFSLFNFKFTFDTNSGVFSKDGLDFGTNLLLTSIDVKKTDQTLLDMGCGYGPIGIVLKKKHPHKEVTMVDVNQKAVELSKHNARLNDVVVQIFKSDLFENILEKEAFDIIISNPPIRVGKKIIYQMYEQAKDFLKIDGRLWLVVRKQQGALSTITYLKTLYQTVDVVKKDRGFFIICAIK